MEMEESGSDGGGGRMSRNGVVMKKEGLGFSNGGIKLENPFDFKALHVFKGFGVLKHQKLVNELMEENEKLRRIIIEDLKVSPEKLKSVST